MPAFASVTFSELSKAQKDPYHVFRSSFPQCLLMCLSLCTPPPLPSGETPALLLVPGCLPLRSQEEMALVFFQMTPSSLSLIPSHRNLAQRLARSLSPRSLTSLPLYPSLAVHSVVPGLGHQHYLRTRYQRPFAGLTPILLHQKLGVGAQGPVSLPAPERVWSRLALGNHSSGVVLLPRITPPTARASPALTCPVSQSTRSLSCLLPYVLSNLLVIISVTLHFKELHVWVDFSAAE